MEKPNHGSTALHQKLVKDFQLEIGIRYEDVVFIPYTVGMFRDFDTANRIIHAGIKGVPDCIVLGVGWYLFFDAKTGGATYTKEQAAFAKRMYEINGHERVFKLRSVNQGIDIINDIRARHAKK